MNDDIRYKAAAAVVALANRSESAGKKSSKEAKGAKWTKAPYDKGLSLDLGKLREAVAYFEIAESIFPARAALRSGAPACGAPRRVRGRDRLPARGP